MKRKVNHVGQNTLTISLPSKWVKRVGLQKGDEVSVEEKGPVLEISTQKRQGGDDVTLNVTNMDRTALVTTLRYYYRNGANTISLHYKNSEIEFARLHKSIPIITVIKEETIRLMGMEIIEQKENWCLLKCMVNEDKADFDNFLRKTFSLIKASFEELSKTDKDPILEIRHNHDSLTRFVSYCIRLLNKFGHGENGETFLWKSMIDSLEMIMDILESSAMKMSESKANITKSFSSIIEKMGSLFEDFMEFYYAFDTKKVIGITKKRIEIENEILKKNLNHDERAILYEISVSLLVLRNIEALVLVMRT